MQRYLGSMEGAVLSGKLTAQAIAETFPKTGEKQAKILTTSQPATNAATV